uniref:Uncharacterized protein n=1 Tax=Streptomyces sp. NBC_00049 TaxID=2903617 RepID=A0AAU2JJF3_9ACTN
MLLRLLRLNDGWARFPARRGTGRRTSRRCGGPGGAIGISAITGSLGRGRQGVVRESAEQLSVAGEVDPGLEDGPDRSDTFAQRQTAELGGDQKLRAREEAHADLPAARSHVLAVPGRQNGLSLGGGTDRIGEHR